MEKIIVELGERSYPVIIGPRLFGSSWPFPLLQYADSGVVLLTDDHIAPMYLDCLSMLLKSVGLSVNQLILPAGESCKSLNMLECIVTELLHMGCDRNVILFALGGGVIGDLVGFAAAIYQRGVRFVQVPTTLLAQVDASIGGKTGVNHPLAKNMIGVFYQPIAVIVNLDCLETLPQRELSSGLAEIIKYGIIFDISFFEWLESHLEDILNLEPISLSYCIRRCCELKSAVVKSDEYDKEEGCRLLLNLGHTYAHAIESYFKYSGQWLHGEAVSVGIMMSANLSRILGYFSNVEVERIRSILLRAGLPVMAPKDMNIEDYLSHMIRDKKNVSHRLRLVIPTSIGKAIVCTDIEHKFIEWSINNVRVE